MFPLLTKNISGGRQIYCYFILPVEQIKFFILEYVNFYSTLFNFQLMNSQYTNQYQLKIRKFCNIYISDYYI